MNRTISVGLIGYGFSGQCFHAPVITAVTGFHLAKVVERHTDHSKTRYPWVEVVRDAEEVYQDPGIELIVITTPSTNHYELALKALLAGKHVVIEKPFTTTVDEADNLIAIARERKLLLSVFHNRRWDGDFKTVKQIVLQGQLGRIVECEFRWDRFNPIITAGRWRESGEAGSGILYDLGVHLIDQTLHLFGMPSSITSNVQTLRDGASADDYFDLRLSYADMNVILKSSCLALEGAPRFVLHGTQGSFVKYGLDPQEHALIQGMTPLSPNWGIEPEEQWGMVNAKIGEIFIKGKVETLPGSYQDYYRNIYETILGKSELAVNMEEARASIFILEAALRSSQERRTIDISEEEV